MDALFRDTGESTDVMFRSFSGTYILNEMVHERRAVYVQVQGREQGTGRGAYLAYCGYDGNNRWTLTNIWWYLQEYDQIINSEDCDGPWDPCCVYDLASVSICDIFLFIL